MPNPDGRNATTPPFNFERLGIRVPTLLISPWIPAGTVVHRPAGPTDTSQFEFSSIGATLRRHFDFRDSFFTARDEWAGTFDDTLTLLDEPRRDCPQLLPPAPAAAAPPVPETTAANDLQRDLVALAAAAAGQPAPAAATDPALTVAAASKLMKDSISQFLGRCPYLGVDAYDGILCRRGSG